MVLFTAFLLDVEHEWDSVENKPASGIVVSLGKVLTGFPSLRVEAEADNYSNYASSSHNMCSSLAKKRKISNEAMQSRDGTGKDFFDPIGKIQNLRRLTGR